MNISSEVLVAFITGVLGPVTVLYIKNIFDKKSKTDVVVDSLKESEKVTKKIEDIIDEFDSDRVWIAQFHNGGNFYPTGKSMTKFSFIYEVVSMGTASVQSSFQNIPVSLFSKPINKLLEDNIIEIYDFEDPTTATYGLKYVAEENNTKSCYMFSIKTIDDKFVGVMGIDFTKNKVQLSSNDILHLRNYSTALASFLVSKTH